MHFGSVCSGKSRTGRPAIDLLGQRFGRHPAGSLVSGENMQFGSVTKTCTKCKEVKSLDDGFHQSARAADGRASQCKQCVNSIKRESRTRNYTPENKRKWALKTRYGLSPDDVEKMIQAQDGACGICKKEMQKPHIDHCHATGKVRGMLCHRCNTRLGGLDDQQWRDAAMRYLGLLS